MDIAVSKKCDRRLFELTHTRAIAMTFTDVRPPDITREKDSHPAGCTFWRLAAEGRAFYTEARDHFGCAVGSYTHGAELSHAQTQELSTLMTTMVKLSYIKQEEVIQLPHRQTPLRYVMYIPLDQSTSLPDVVLVRGNAWQLMMLSEAARIAGCMKESPAMGRPACAMIPESMASGQVVLSLGCIGSRIYTGQSDHEGYLAIPGTALEATCTALATILQANETLAHFHRQRQMQFVEGV